MDDRDKDLTQLFVRDLDALPLPPRGAWRRASRKEHIAMRTSRSILTAGAAVAVLVLALIVGLQLRDRSSQVASSPSPVPATSTPVPASSPPATPSPVATTSPAAAGLAGAITGRFGYPADYIPAVTVYAVSTTDSRVWYSVDFAGFGNPPRPTLPPGATEATYTLSGVAPGTYWVVAYRNDGQRPDPGYYSRQVECSRSTPSGPCPDITMAPVTVVAGQTLKGIDIVTWFPGPSGQPSPTFPPRPTPRP